MTGNRTTKEDILTGFSNSSKLIFEIPIPYFCSNVFFNIHHLGQVERMGPMAVY
jgi:hypothetical protein